MDVSSRSGITEDIVEKDYYITLILRELVRKNPEIVFKGGTSLSKAHHIINRFSEDVDITFTEHIGSSKRKKLKYDIIGKISEEIELPILNWDKIESDKEYNHYDFGYESISEIQNPVPPTVILETALMSYAFPTEEKEITSIVYDYLWESDKEILEQYDLLPFSMRVQSVNRTLIDKMFAVCDYYMLDRSRRNSRHLYDIYKLYPHVIEDEAFYELVKEVWLHRSKMDKMVAPSARENVDILGLVGKLSDEDFYKDDYDNRTKGLISDDLSYDVVIAFYRQLMERVLSQVKFDYTKWQKERFDDESSDDFINAAIAYNEKNHLYNSIQLL